jgi:hypothetical protein
MARRIRENEALLERLLAETGEERTYLPGGYVLSRSKEGPPQGAPADRRRWLRAALHRRRGLKPLRHLPTVGVARKARHIGVEICTAPI